MSRVIVCCVCFLALPALNARGNQVVNGDFQTGGLAPSTTAYTLSGDMLAPETWNIVSSDTIHPQWDDFFDHTHGDANGLYMIVNGSTSGAGPTWAQSIAVSPNTLYQYSAWFATLFADSPSSVELRVYDGATLIDSSPFFTPGPTAVWGSHSMLFNSGAATTVSVEVWDTSLLFGGNDYAIDDISVNVAVPEPGSIALLAAGLASAAAFQCRRRFRQRRLLR